MPRGYQISFLLNSAKHDILNTSEYKISRNSAFFKAQLSQKCYFFLANKS